jgi:hypothetical protein
VAFQCVNVRECPLAQRLARAHIAFLTFVDWRAVMRKPDIAPEGETVTIVEI